MADPLGRQPGPVFGERVFDDPNLILPGWDLAVPRPAVLIPPLVLSAADEHVPAGPLPRAATPPRRRPPPQRSPTTAAPEHRADHGGGAETTPAVGRSATNPSGGLWPDEGGAPALDAAGRAPRVHAPGHRRGGDDRFGPAAVPAGQRYDVDGGRCPSPSWPRW